MNRHLIIPAALLAVILTFTSVHAEVLVSATVDRNRIVSGESIQLTVSIKGGKGEVDTSAITDFSVHSRGTSSRIQIINGRTSREVIHSFVLIPLREGELTIPSLTARIDGEEYKTAPITITVSEAADDKEDGGDVFVNAVVSEERPYVGQQVVYTFSFLNAVQVTDARFQPPEFDGFTFKELENRRSYTKTINGRTFAVVDIDFILVPLTAGTITIEPAVIQVGIVNKDTGRRRSPFDDFFNDPFFNRGSVTPKVLQTDPLVVDARSLPPFDGPGNFSGLIGRFELSAELENTQLQVGDSTTLTLTISGRGNIMDADIAAFNIPDMPDGFKSYTDSPQEDVTLNHKGYSGRKVFRIALVPVKSGKFELPAVSLTYFDVDQVEYSTLTASLPSLYVTPVAPSEAGPTLVTPATPEQVKEKVAFSGRDILPLKEELDALKPYRSISPLAFLLWLMSPAVVFGGLLFVQRFRREDFSPSARMKVKTHQALKAAQAVLRNASNEDSTRFLSYLYQALTSAIFSAAGKSGEAMTWKEAEELLLGTGQNPEIARKAAQLLSSIESTKFSGVRISVDQYRGMLDATRELVRRLVP